MLPAAARLRRRKDFISTTRAGRRASRTTVVVTLAHPEAGTLAPVPARVGFAVGRTIGGSVTRHLITRRLRHLMAERLDRLRPGDQVVVRALPPAGTADYQDLGRDLDAALHQLLRARR